MTSSEARSVLEETPALSNTDVDSDGKNIPAPVLERDDSILVQDLTCTLCHEISVQPTTTPCDHLFCRKCIESALQYSEVCPNCRNPLNRRQLTPLSGILRRLWEKVQVRCPQRGCNWRGCLASYVNHASNTCSSRWSSSNNKESDENGQERLEEMERKISHLSSKVMDLTNLLEDTKEMLMQSRSQREQDVKHIRDLEEKFRDMHAEVLMKSNMLCDVRGQLQNSKQKLDNILESNQQIIETRKPFDTSYKYDRWRAVELAQLICRDLESKPGGIDQNRIFTCVRNIHRDYKRDRTDNPNSFHHDVKMLLSICNATLGWFSDRQLASIDNWLGEMQ